jgi:hypothetical protein
MTLPGPIQSTDFRTIFSLDVRPFLDKDHKNEDAK